MILLVLLLITLTSFSQNPTCSTKNTVVRSGEKLKYEISYNWGLIWVNAGEASFETTLIQQNNKPYYKFTGLGATYPKYDWMYKVRDRFETICDTAYLKPLRYIRDTHEGATVNYSDNIFNYSSLKAYSFTRVKNKTVKADSVKIETCTFDVLSMIYSARNIDFNSYPKNTRIPISLYLDNAVYSLYIDYLGKETITTEMGTFNCIKFHPMLVEGTIFKAGDDMTVWVTDDKNKLPLYVETPILVGTIKAKLKSYEGLKNPISAKIK